MEEELGFIRGFPIYSLLQFLLSVFAPATSPHILALPSAIAGTNALNTNLPPNAGRAVFLHLLQSMTFIRNHFENLALHTI